MYYMWIGAAALSMVCGPVILRWFRSRRLRRQLSMFQYVCVKPISTAGARLNLNAAPQFDETALTGDSAVGDSSVFHASSFFGWLGSLAPKFGVNGDKIKLLSEPRQFYDTLLSLSETAEKRIVLSSLYLGTDSLERDLVEVIRKRVHAENRMGHGDLAVRILLDYSRGSRGKTSSRTILLPLLTEFPDHVKVSLFHSPDLRGLSKMVLPERVNEIVGLQHMKIYIFDNSIVISGANLSVSYFDNRQDRYILLENCDEIADFFAALVDVVSSFSFQLQPNGSSVFPADFPHHPFHGFDGGEKFRGLANQAVQSLLHFQTRQPATHSFPVNNATTITNTVTSDFTADSYHSALSCPVRIEKSPLLDAVHLNAERRGSSSLDSTAPSRADSRSPASSIDSSSGSSGSGDASKTNDDDDGEIDTWIYPLVQMGPLGVHVDSTATQALIESAPSNAEIFLASGYFNLTQNYMDVILDESKADFQILMASPKVNGFYGAQGISGNIPAVYTSIAKEFHSKVANRNHDFRIALHEFYRDDWTFHAKGLWYYMPGESLPSMTLIGSPNFGFRSVSRDLEAQIAVVTENTTLRRRLDEERKRLYAPTNRVTQQTFLDEDHAVPNWVGLVTDWIKNYF